MTVFVSCSPARVAPRWLLVAFAFVVAIAAYPVEAASGDYPADPPGDVSWPWSDWAPAGIETIWRSSTREARIPPSRSTS